MSAPWTIRIYGSDTNYSPTATSVLNTLLVANVAPLGNEDVVYAEFDVGWIEPDVISEGSEITYANNRKEGFNKIRFSYNPKTKAKNFPTVGQTLESYYNIEPLTKRYKWLFLNDFELRPDDSGSPLPVTKSIRVAFTGISISHEDGIKYVVYEFEQADII